MLITDGVRLNSGLNSKCMHSACNFSVLKYTISCGLEFKTEIRTTVKITNKVSPEVVCIVNTPKSVSTLKFALEPGLTVF